MVWPPLCAMISRTRAMLSLSSLCVMMRIDITIRVAPWRSLLKSEDRDRVRACPIRRWDSLRETRARPQACRSNRRRQRRGRAPTSILANFLRPPAVAGPFASDTLPEPRDASLYVRATCQPHRAHLRTLHPPHKQRAARTLSESTLERPSDYGEALRLRRDPLRKRGSCRRTVYRHSC